MKTGHPSALLILAALGGIVLQPLAAAPRAEPPPHAFPVAAIRQHNGWKAVVPGSTVNVVRRNLGDPCKILGKEYWVYRQCRPEIPRDRDFNCHLLILEIKDDRVAAMKFVNPRALAVISACVREGRQVNYVASNLATR